MSALLSFRARSAVSAAKRDVVAGGILLSAVLMFVGSAGSYVNLALDRITDIGGGGRQVLMTTLLLNVALILFGWRRYRDLRSEVVQRTVAELRAQSLADRDPLTGLLNRRSLREEGARLIARCRSEKRSVALVLVDLDHFKNVNDIHGHTIGDRLLSLLSDGMSDVLPEGALIGRLGGDEFVAVIAFDKTRREEVERRADRLMGWLSSPHVIAGNQVHVGASLGLAELGAECTDIGDMLRQADVAMYQSKKLGRGRWMWFDDSMEVELRIRNEIEAGLRLGVPKGEFVPYYERQIDLANGELRGFEALARWNHPEKGLIAPDVFIRVAEETGLIADLSASIMEQAFQEAKDWPANLTLSVNISPVQLRDPWLSEKIIKLLRKTSFPPQRLEIEITESAIYENLELAKATIESLKNQGVKLALDDFGTGYSSLAHLQALPFDRLKIDRSFVQRLGDDKHSAQIVAAITGLAKSMNLPITAEGVEDGKIEAILRGMGEYNAQGWHLGKPQTVESLREFLIKEAERMAGSPPPVAKPADSSRR